MPEAIDGRQLCLAAGAIHFPDHRFGMVRADNRIGAVMITTYGKLPQLVRFDWRRLPRERHERSELIGMIFSDLPRAMSAGRDADQRDAIGINRILLFH